jgi:peptidyl-prolyl cis-trans isomerase SurA
LLEERLIQVLKPWRNVSLVALAFFTLASSCNRQSDKDVLAKVNAYKVTRSEVDRAYNRQIIGAPQKPSSEEESALRLQILDQIIGRQVYLQKAEKLGILATDDEVESRATQDKAPYTKEEFTKKLQDAGFTEDEWRLEIRRKLTIDKLLNKEIASKVTISDSDIQNYYDTHKAQFNIIEPQYYLAHIFVSAQPNVPSGDLPNKAQNETQAREKIRQIYNRLESGEDFASLAGKYSEDPNTSRNGGELGPAPESQLRGNNTDPATRDAIAKLKPGQFSEVIPIVNPATQKVLAFRIVKLLAKEAAGQRDLSDPTVQQAIRNQLRTQREQFLRSAYDEVLRDSTEIHNYYAEQLLKNAGQK